MRQGGEADVNQDDFRHLRAQHDRAAKFGAKVSCALGCGFITCWIAVILALAVVIVHFVRKIW